MKLLTKSYTYKIAIEFGTLCSLAKVKINLFLKDKIFILIRAVKKNHCKILLLPNNLIILVKTIVYDTTHQSLSWLHWDMEKGVTHSLTHTSSIIVVIRFWEYFYLIINTFWKYHHLFLLWSLPIFKTWSKLT